MLPIYIYEPCAQVRALISDALEQLFDQLHPPARINCATGSADDLNRYLDAEPGISLTVLGLSPQSSEQRQKCLQIGEQLMCKNRDSYTLFCIHDLSNLNELLQNCMRPAGILMYPFTMERTKECLRRIIEDYQALNQSNAEDHHILINNGGSTHRLAYSSVMYIESINKKLCIYTQRQAISVRNSLNALEKRLPPDFVRCHRSYIINSNFVADLDYVSMLLTLSNGDTLPISRSCKTSLKQFFESRDTIPERSRV